MHLLLTIGLVLLIAGVIVMVVAICKAKPDPNEEDKNRGKVIHFVDEKGHLHYKDEPKMKVK